VVDFDGEHECHFSRLKRTQKMKKFWIVFAVISVIIGGGFGMLWFTMQNLEDTVAIDGGVLVWRVAGSFPEERDESFWGQIQGGGETTVTELIFTLNRAAEDDRITAMVMDMRALATDWAKIDEIRTAVTEFQASGKTVVAYIDNAGTREYALACLADQVVVSPEASIMVLGVKAELAFMKDVLDKLGMEADFVHVGAYKSAPERMTRTTASDSNREMITSIVDDRYNALVMMLSTSRNVGAQEVSGWIDQGLFDGPEAVAAGLADTIMYYDEVFEHHFADESITTLDDYRFASHKSVPDAKKVGLVHITGVIMPGESRNDRLQGKLVGSDTVAEELQILAEDDEVDAVILRVDSPGGSALASDLIWNEVRKVQKIKPVIVSMSGYAASGGYYVSCLADSIFADPGTLTGSIGVYAGKMSRTKMYEKIGVNREFITRGENALLFSDEGGFTDTQRVQFQGKMDNFYERFLQKVADGRDLTRDQAHAVAQGRVWTGRQGVEHGLVDELGGLDRAVKSVKWMLGLQPEDKVSLVSFSEPLTFLERILIKSVRDSGIMASVLQNMIPAELVVGDNAMALSPLPALFAALKRDGTFAAVSLMNGQPIAMMPFYINLNGN
jgi:protease-4